MTAAEQVLLRRVAALERQAEEMQELQVNLSALTYAWLHLVLQLEQYGALDADQLEETMRSFRWLPHPRAQQAEEAMKNFCDQWAQTRRLSQETWGTPR